MAGDETITLTHVDSPGGNAVEHVIRRELGSVELIREIGRGGMGVVWLGRDRMLERDVAVKFLLNAASGADDPGFARFLEGARSAAAVRHERLTAVHNADLIDDIPYLVMEYIDGPTLADAVQRWGPLSLETVLAALAAVCEAVGALHDQEIVHRDIKPSNVLLDEDGEVFVTDFGLACRRSVPRGGATPVGLAGTPAYMAPEMFDGVVSLRSDVYALGIMTFELLTGSLPFTGTLEEIQEKHVHQPLPVATLRGCGIDAGLIEVLERATHKKALFRYKTARHFLQVLKDAVTDVGVWQRGAARLAELAARRPEGPSAEADRASAVSKPSTYFDLLSERASRKRGDSEPAVEPGPATREPDRPAAVKRERTLWADVSCMRCGYNLRGLREGRRCPECGAPPSSSLHPHLRFADREWLSRVVLGQTLVYLAFAAAVVVSVAVGVALTFLIRAKALPAAAESAVRQGSPWAMLVAYAVCAAGVVLATVAEPGKEDREPRLSARRVAGVAMAVWVTLQVAWIVQPRVLPALSGTGWALVFNALGNLVGFVAVVGFVLYQASLAARVPDRRLAARCRRFVAAFAFFVTIAAFVSAARQVGFGAAGSADWLAATGSVLLVLLLILGIGLWWLTGTCRRAFKKVQAGCVELDTVFRSEGGGPDSTTSDGPSKLTP